MLFILFSFLSSCIYNTEEDCKYFLVPVPETMYVVVGAGSSDSNGEYHDAYSTWNDKPIFIRFGVAISTTYLLCYEATYGWCIKQNGLSGDILYYSDIHTDEPPGESSTTWYHLNGTDPAPVVTADIYYDKQLVGNCL